ncbi:MAG: SDR family oxidoreductase [Burkholderiales bacterium]|nr:SDR family oxidoreductase [Burkholderiales bacterium]
MTGSKVVVVGGGSGIGLAVAKAAAAAGARVVIAGRDAGKLAAAAREIGTNVATASADARDEGQLAALFAVQAPIDHLVVTVGPGSTRQRYTSFLEQPTTDARALFDNKFWAQYLCAKLAAPHIAKGGSITLFGGGASRRPVKAMAALAAVQAAIEGLTRGMALDLAPVRVNAVAPGRIASSSFADMPDAARKEMLDKWAAGLPVGRIGLPEDAAAAALYLMGNAYTTGNILYVDGGHYLA